MITPGATRVNRGDLADERAIMTTNILNLSRTLPMALVATFALVQSLPAAPDIIGPSGEPRLLEVDQASESFQKGKVDEAYALLQEAVKKKPTLPPARLMLARFFLLTDQAKTARQVLEQAASENPRHPDVYLTVAGLSLAEGRFTEALLSYQAALDHAAADNWTAQQKLVFRREARAGLATGYETRQDWSNARTHLAAWVELDPKSAPAHHRLGRCLFQLGKADEAEAELEEAARLGTTLEPAAVTLARLWSQKGEQKKAGEWLDKAVQRHGKNLRVQTAFAEWLVEQGRLDEALTRVDAAAKIDAKAREPERLRGLVARLGKDYPTAEKIFTALATDAPNEFYPADQLALVLIEQKDEDRRRRAVKLAEANARQFAAIPEALATLGWIYFRTDKAEDAEKLLTVALSSGVASADASYYLARVLEKNGKTAEIPKLLRRALDTKGMFVYRKEAQAWLKELKKE
jgi:Tfp pilus assembly protein PilF